MATGQGLDPRLGGADQDPLALLAPQHLVDGRIAQPPEVDLVEFQSTSATTALAQLRSTDTAIGGADLGVDGKQVLTDIGHNSRAVGTDLGGFGVEPRDGLVPRLSHRSNRRVKLGTLGLQSRDVGLQPLGALHHLEFDVLQLTLPPGQRHEFVLDRLQVLGRAGAGIEAALVALGAVAHQLHIRLGLGHLALDVIQRRLGQGHLTVQGRRLLSERRELGVVGQRGPRVIELVQTGVESLQVQQPQLAERVGFQCAPPASSAPTTKSQGSVRRVET